MRQNVNDLLAFLAVARDKSFTKAAKQLSLSPPRVSEMIRNLEERLGVRLVERTTRFTMLLHLPPMDGHGPGARVKNGPALAATMPRLYATPSRARSRPCLRSCGDR